MSRPPAPPGASPRGGPPAGLLAGLAALLLVLLLVLGSVLGVGGGGGAQLAEPSDPPSAVPASPSPSPIAAPQPSAGTSPRATPTPAPSRSPGSEQGRPEVAVVAAEDGQVTVLDTEDGSAVRVLVAPGELGGIARVSLSPDRETAYVSTDGCPATTYSVPVGGGEAEVLVEGGEAALSPDGATLAYAADAAERDGPDTDGVTCANALVLRDTSSGEERTLLPSTQGDLAPLESIGRISWAADSRRLVYQASYEQRAAVVVDTGAADSLADASGVALDDDGDLASPAWVPGQDAIVAVRQCCFPEYDASPAAVVLADLASGAAQVVAQPDGGITGVALDASGEHLLLLLPTELAMLPIGGGEPESLATAVVDAAW